MKVKMTIHNKQALRAALNGSKFKKTLKRLSRKKTSADIKAGRIIRECNRYWNNSDRMQKALAQLREVWPNQYQQGPKGFEHFVADMRDVYNGRAKHRVFLTLPELLALVHADEVIISDDMTMVEIRDIEKMLIRSADDSRIYRTERAGERFYVVNEDGQLMTIEDDRPGATTTQQMKNCVMSFGGQEITVDAPLTTSVGRRQIAGEKALRYAKDICQKTGKKVTVARAVTMFVAAEPKEIVAP